jgi:hypothetical protein
VSNHLRDLKINFFAGLVIGLPFLLDLIYGPYQVRLWMLSLMDSIVFIAAFNLGKWAHEKEIKTESIEGTYISRFVLPRNMNVKGSYQVISFAPGERKDALNPTPSYFILESIPEKYRFHVFSDSDFTLPKKFQVSMHTHIFPGAKSVEYQYNEYH